MTLSGLLVGDRNWGNWGWIGESRSLGVCLYSLSVPVVSCLSASWFPWSQQPLALSQLRNLQNHEPKSEFCYWMFSRALCPQHRWLCSVNTLYSLFVPRWVSPTVRVFPTVSNVCSTQLHMEFHFNSADRASTSNNFPSISPSHCLPPDLDHQWCTFTFRFPQYLSLVGMTACA